jgi:hypothetical protein
MEVQEISSRLDYALQQAKGGLILDEYQKSLYITKAQVLFVDDVLSKYEYGDTIRHILGPLIVKAEETSFSNEGTDLYGVTPEFGIKSILYEEVNAQVMTIPLDYNDIHDARVNPFRKPYKKLAYRITGNDILTIFSSEIPTVYKYDYCKEPQAIVLETIPTELAIQGIETETESELPYDSVMKVIDLAVVEILRDIQRLTPPKQEAKK